MTPTPLSPAETLARKFHEAYERLAPKYGYETRAETRAFDPESANGKLMTAVCAELSAVNQVVQEPSDDEILRMASYLGPRTKDDLARTVCDDRMLFFARAVIAKALAASPPAAPQPPAEKYDDVLAPFLTLMRRELHANCGKGDRPGWLAMSANEGLLEVYYHLAKLQKAVKQNDGPAIQEYSADVANMAMMVLDICGGLAFVAASPQPVSQPGEALPAFAKGSWQHAVDDALVPYMKTSHDFATPHDAVKWLLQITAETAGEALPAEQPKSDKSYALAAVGSDLPPALTKAGK